jgi:hypothetical protein
MGEAEAKTAIAEYMLKQNRPYSVQNIFDNMHGKVHKKVLVSVLEELVTDKVL